MPSLPRLPEGFDAQVEWFHALSKALDGDQVDVIDTTLRADFGKFVTHQLPALPPPSKLTDAGFIEAVLSLRRNEGRWNRSLMQAIIEASNRAESGQPREAAADLRIFASSCPWVMFAEVATRQAASFPV